MNGKGLRSSIHCRSRFFNREGVKNLQPMKGKGLRGHIHFEFTDIQNPLSFLLNSPVLLPDNFSRPANPLPVASSRNANTIPANRNITQTNPLATLLPRGFHLVHIVGEEPDG